jgi:hypothetical protein
MLVSSCFAARLAGCLKRPAFKWLSARSLAGSGSIDGRSPVARNLLVNVEMAGTTHMRSLSKTAEELADLAIDTAVTASGSLKDLGTQMARLAMHLGGRREPNRLRSALWLAGGTAALAGGVVFLFTAPGRELRRQIESLFRSAESKVAGGNDRDGEDNMANEGGGSRPRSEEHHLDGAH